MWEALLLSCGEIKRIAGKGLLAPVEESTGHLVHLARLGKVEDVDRVCALAAVVVQPMVIERDSGLPPLRLR